MSFQRSLTTVVLALHLDPERAASIVKMMGLDPASVPYRVLNWKHVRYSNETTTLLFGPSGLRRVRASELIPQLSSQGFRFIDCSLVYKQAVYTKKEARKPMTWADFERGTSKIEGQPKYDDQNQAGFKIYIEISLVCNNAVSSSLPLKLLEDILKKCVWKRGRVIVVREKDGTQGAALVELVQLASRRSSLRGQELSFHPTRGFESHYIDLP